MARTGPSPADQQLISQLAARDLNVSAAQLERWRHAGLLPRNSRHGGGRGRGSASEASPQAVEIAATLSRHARQGRDLRLAVIDWFADAGRAIPPGKPAIPEPPHAAVRSALMWAIATDPVYQLFQLARSARTEADQDKFYGVAGAAVARWSRPAFGFDPAVMREALLTRRDLPDGTIKSAQQVHSGMIQLFAAIGMGFGEVPADLLAKAMDDTGLVPQMSETDVQRVLTRFEEPPSTGPESLVERLITRYDPLDMLSLATADSLKQARTAAGGLFLAGGLYLLHALLMPDTPGLAALRATIDGLGLGPWLLETFRSFRRPDDTKTFSTDGFAFIVVSCLHPFMWAIHKLLADQIENGPLLLPDDVPGEEKFMADWMTTLKDTARQSRLDRAAGSERGGRDQGSMP
jgi:hypothetical protein